MKYPFIWLIRIYQLCLSPFIGQVCRFTPTCSQYSIDAFRKHGVFRGAVLTAKRLCKCHPWHPGGHDEA